MIRPKIQYYLLATATLALLVIIATHNSYSAARPPDDMHNVLLPVAVAAPAFAGTPYPDAAVTFNAPTAITHAGDDRLFIAAQKGTVHILEPDGTRRLFLDITDRVIQWPDRDWEQGLLGLALHPHFAVNGEFFVYYIALSAEPDEFDMILSRFRTSADPNAADPASEEQLLIITKDRQRHNGGSLAFGPLDGYLYVAVGDGEHRDNAQDISRPEGKILRLDVDGGTPYAVPPDNPFVGTPGARPEIWAYGLRNPWGIAFDAVSGELFIADVGSDYREEVNYQPGGAPGGSNYGWPCYEGFMARDPADGGSACHPSATLTPPVYDYAHDNGRCAVIGGGIERQPPFLGQALVRYVFGDGCTGEIFTLLHHSDGSWTTAVAGTLGVSVFLSTLGSDAAGALLAGQWAAAAPLLRLTLP